ncbi:MAG: hypothetical protein KAJ55_06725 [Anaerolineales bacterium]|nr:hypothetical protein [Anaerolineales bacterium]
MENSVIEAKITLEGVHLTWTQENMVKTKVVSLPDFARTLLQQVGLTVGPLPLGPNARGVRYIKQADALYIYVEDPPRPLPSRFREEELNIITPRSLWEMKLVGASTQGGKLQDVRVWSLAEPLLSTSVDAYSYNFSNTYNDGRICWGGNRNVMIERTFVELLEIPDIYWSSGFNGDVDQKLPVMIAGQEYKLAGDIMKAMHRTGQGIDPDSLSNPRPFANILESAGGGNGNG